VALKLRNMGTIQCYILYVRYIAFIYDENLRTLPAGMIVVKVLQTNLLYSLGLLAHTQDGMPTSLSAQHARSVKLFFFLSISVLYRYVADTLASMLLLYS